MILLLLTLSFIGAQAANDCLFAATFKCGCTLGGLTVEIPERNITVDESNCNSVYPKDMFDTQTVKVTYEKADPSLKYLLLMVDPDAPGHPKGYYFLHWIVANITGEDLANGNIENGYTLTGYRKPNPPKGSGYHRYIFMVYSHHPEAEITSKVEDSMRRKFNMAKWIESVSEQVPSLCGPIAATQYRTSYDSEEKDHST